MKSPILNLPLEKVKSKWYNDILSQWQPDPEYIQYLTSQIEKKAYLPPIIVVQEDDGYYIVNGHHRYYAHILCREKSVKCLLISGTFAQSEPLRKAEVMLKEFDQKAQYRYRLSDYLDRWAAAAENQEFIDKYRPGLGYRLYQQLKKIKTKLKK